MKEKEGGRVNVIESGGRQTIKDGIQGNSERTLAPTDGRNLHDPRARSELKIRRTWHLVFDLTKLSLPKNLDGTAKNKPTSINLEALPIIEGTN
jgi:hypothetical protein